MSLYVTILMLKGGGGGGLSSTTTSVVHPLGWATNKKQH